MSMDLHKNYLNSLLIQGHSYEEGFFSREDCKGKTFWRSLKSNCRNGDCVIFLHGTGNDHLFGMYRIFTELLNQGFDIFTFDIDGMDSKALHIFKKKTANIFWVKL